MTAPFASVMAKLEAVAPALIDAALRGVIVLVLALVITHLLRKRTAAARHLVWVGAVVIQLTLPLFAIWGPRWDVAVSSNVASILPVELPTTPVVVVPVAPVSDVLGRPVTTVRDEAAVAPLQKLNDAIAAPSTESGMTLTGRQILLAIWLIGAVLILLRLAVGTSIVAALARRGNRVEDGAWLSLSQRLSTSLGIDRPLTLLRGDKLGVPITWGIVYPVVLLPDDADQWPEERRRFVLVHEMAHVKRLDALTQLAGQFALALFWFNPLVWIANRRMQLEREHACDDYVIRHGTVPSTYAEELLAMVRSIGSTHQSTQPAFAALAMARRSEFEGRMLSILDPVLDRHPLSTGRSLLGALAALVMVVPLAALQPYRRPAVVEQPVVQGKAPDTTQSQRVKALADSVRQLERAVMDGRTQQLAARNDTAELARRQLTIPIQELAKKTAELDSARQSLGKKLGKVSTSFPTCDAARFTGSTELASTSIHSSDDSDHAGTPLLEYIRRDGVRCVSATIVGKPVYAPNEDDIVSVPFGAHATFRERTAESDRALTMSRATDGSVVKTYRVNGENAPYDAAARAWFAKHLPTVLVNGGMNVQPRVARWTLQGGPDTALARIAALSSSSAKRSHYLALLDVPNLTDATLDRIIRQAGRNITSSGDLRAVLKKAAPRRGGGIRSGSALEEAIVGISSSGDKTSVLMEYGQTTDREMLLSVMRVATTITSSGDKTRLLKNLAPKYLDGEDKTLVSSFFSTALTIPSSGDLSRLLVTAVPFAARSDEITRRIIAASEAVPSSGDRAEVLVALVRSGAVNTKGLRDAFFAAAATIPSDVDRSRVLLTAARY